jgi:hypothetical protein
MWAFVRVMINAPLVVYKSQLAVILTGGYTGDAEMGGTGESPD